MTEAELHFRAGVQALADRLVRKALDNEHYGDLDTTDVIATAIEFGVVVQILEPKT